MFEVVSDAMIFELSVGVIRLHAALPASQRIARVVG